MGSVANVHLQGTHLHNLICCAQPLSKCMCIPWIVRTSFETEVHFSTAAAMNRSKNVLGAWRAAVHPYLDDCSAW